MRKNLKSLNFPIENKSNANIFETIEKVINKSTNKEIKQIKDLLENLLTQNNAIIIKLSEISKKIY